MSDPLTLIHSDALSSLRELPDESVQTCVTSPPYWGLRDYGLEPSIWGPLSRPWEPAQCRHQWEQYLQPSANGQTTHAMIAETLNESSATRKPKLSDFCKCGAWRGCLGLEPSPELYVSHMVEIFREVRRVLRGDGTLWLNLGDSYGTGTTAVRKQGARGLGANTQEAQDAVPRCGGMAKQLIGIPWRVAFALQSDGWYLRSDIIWSKPNPMPESVTDRPTKSHEYIFLLSKSERYYYDADAIAEPNQQIVRPNYDGRRGMLPKGSYQGVDRCGNRKRDATPRNDGERWNENNGRGFIPESGTRNKRTVWTVTTQPFSGAHFATFPPDLIKPCILAGAPVGGVVIDPFAGSGTTGKVAIELGRKAILIEPKAEYIEMIKRRCQTTIGLPMTG